MSKNNKKQNLKAGITLIEIMVVVFIIATLSTILIADFPRVKKQMALSRIAHKFMQDLKTAQDLGGSGSQIINSNGNALTTKGCGIYINQELLGDQVYLIYADIDGNNQYNQGTDYVISQIDFSGESEGIYIYSIYNANSQGLSINFEPPNFTTKIADLLAGKTEVGVVFAVRSDSSITKSIYVNTSGLIELR